MGNSKRLLVITGPTASGKTGFAVEKALEYGSPVISCDSRQIYRELKIGTAPPTAEQLAQVKHYFIFSHSIFDHYTAGKYELEALELINELFLTHDTLIMAGGSGLYIDALCNGIDDFPESDLVLRKELTQQLSEEGLAPLAAKLKLLDPESYEAIDIKNPQRVMRALEVCLSTGNKFSSYKTSPSKRRNFTIDKIILDHPREELYERINHRVDEMMAAGLLEEAERMYPHRDLPSLNTVGYKELFGYFSGEHSLDEAVDLIKRNTRRYAKRQMTWFRRY